MILPIDIINTIKSMVLGRIGSSLWLKAQANKTNKSENKNATPSAMLLQIVRMYLSRLKMDRANTATE